MCLFLEESPRLVKADMSVVTKPQELEIHGSRGVQDLIVFPAGVIAVSLRSIGEESSASVNIHFPKQIFLHKIVITLGILRGNPLILIQVDCSHKREVQFPLLMPLRKLTVNAYRSGTCGKTQHTVGLHNNLCGDKVCSRPAHVIVILCPVNFHAFLFPVYPKFTLLKLRIYINIFGCMTEELNARRFANYTMIRACLQ